MWERQESICPKAHVQLPPLNWHTDSLRLFDGQDTAPMGRRAMSALSPLFVRADEAIEIVERVIAGYGTTRISRSGARRYPHR
jgi:hypothetical protein